MNDVQPPVVRQGPRWIVDPPLGTGERMSVNDPEPSYTRLGSRQSGDRHCLAQARTGINSFSIAVEGRESFANHARAPFRAIVLTFMKSRSQTGWSAYGTFIGATAPPESLARRTVSSSSCGTHGLSARNCLR